MARMLDYLTLSAILLVLSFVFGVLIFENVWLSLVVAISLSAAIVFSIGFFSKKKSKVSPSKLATYFAIKGNEYVIDLLKRTLNNKDAVCNSTSIVFKDCAIVACYKFGNVSSQDVVNAQKAIGGADVKTIFMLANGIDKKAYQVADFLGIRLKLTKTSTLARYLERHDALPDLKKPKTKFSAQAFFEAVFARNNFKAYAFSGTVLVLTSFITPLRLYYIISGSICLMLAIFSLFFGNGNLSSSNPFKKLKSAADSDCADVDKDKD